MTQWGSWGNLTKRKWWRQPPQWTLLPNDPHIQGIGTPAHIERTPRGSGSGPPSSLGISTRDESAVSKAVLVNWIQFPASSEPAFPTWDAACCHLKRACLGRTELPSAGRASDLELKVWRTVWSAMPTSEKVKPEMVTYILGMCRESEQLMKGQGGR